MIIYITYIRLRSQLILLTRLDNGLDMGEITINKRIKNTSRLLFYGLSYSVNGDDIFWGEDSERNYVEEYVSLACQV